MLEMAVTTGCGSWRLPGCGPELLPVAGQVVVPIDSGPWGHAAHPDAIILCRDDAGYRGAVVFISAIYVMTITIAGIVVVVEGGIDVWGKVLMGVVHPVINHGDVDPCAIDALTHTASTLMSSPPRS